MAGELSDLSGEERDLAIEGIREREADFRELQRAGFMTVEQERAIIRSLSEIKAQLGIQEGPRPVENSD